MSSSSRESFASPLHDFGIWMESRILREEDGARFRRIVTDIAHGRSFPALADPPTNCHF
jgi:hypothetical protein